jgi:hypothetical protein
VIQYELFDKACNDSLITRLITAWVRNTFTLTELYVHSLPKSSGLKLMIRLSLDIFVSTISPKLARAACDLAGKKNNKLSAPCVPVEGWSNHREGGRKVDLS